MNDEQKELLGRVFTDLGEGVMAADFGSDEHETSVKEFATITDKLVDLDKQNKDYTIKKQELDIKERELDLKERELANKVCCPTMFEKGIRVAEVAIPVLTMGVGMMYKSKWTKQICKWEETGTFRSTPGRSVKDAWFKWKL